MSHIYKQKNYDRSFGTFPLQGDDLINALTHAIKVGYRSIDTAQMYNNEDAVGAFIANCGMPKNDLLVTTKVHPDNLSEEKFIPSVHASLKKLDMDCVNILLLHWPCTSGDNTISLQLLEECYKQGLAQYIGISNYNSTMMRQCQDIISTPLCCNQIEFHPLLDQNIMLQASAETHIPLTAYCPVARGKVFEYDLFENIGKDIGKTAGQVVLKWILQKGVTLQVMSTNPTNIKNNYALDDFTLSNAQMAEIDTLNSVGYRLVNADLVPWCPEWD